MPRGKVSMDVISEAWTFLQPNIGPWLLAMVAYFGVTYGFSIVQNLVQLPAQNGGSPIWIVLSLVIQLIGSLVSQLLLGGLAKMAIGTVRTRVANINEMWTVTNVWLGLVLSGILQGLFYIIACLPGLIVLGVSVFAPLSQAGVFSPAVLNGGKAPNIPPSVIGGMVGGISVGMLLILLASAVRFSLFYLATFLIVDRKTGAWEAISTSAKALKKHFWSSLLLLFVLALINTGGVMACCVGLFLTVPLSQIAIALVYRDLFGMGEAPPQATVYAPPPIASPNF